MTACQQRFSVILSEPRREAVAGASIALDRCERLDFIARQINFAENVERGKATFLDQLVHPLTRNANRNSGDADLSKTMMFAREIAEEVKLSAGVGKGAFTRNRGCWHAGKLAFHVLRFDQI